MQDALASLEGKGTPITSEEVTAALATALLHDIGHGPFSHTLEHLLIDQFRHEDMSRVLLCRLNERFDGRLSLAIDMFDNAYERTFFHQLISSQLDMDRLDYLRRDAFYTGVAEGQVGVQRIIKTLCVHPVDGPPGAQIAVEAKGMYAVENFLLARRLMYWQVYLHKTVLAGDHLLTAIIRRARHLLQSGARHMLQSGSPDFLFFLNHTVDGSEIEQPDVVDAYCRLDDTDLLYTLKRWQDTGDPILSDLTRRFVNRDFFRVTFLDNEPAADTSGSWGDRIRSWMIEHGLTSTVSAANDVQYYLSRAVSRHFAYERIADSIRVIDRRGTVRELSEMSNTVSVPALTRFEEKPYLCYPKEVDLLPVT